MFIELYYVPGTMLDSGTLSPDDGSRFLSSKAEVGTEMNNYEWRVTGYTRGMYKDTQRHKESSGTYNLQD